MPDEKLLHGLRYTTRIMPEKKKMDEKKCDDFGVKLAPSSRKQNNSQKRCTRYILIPLLHRSTRLRERAPSFRNAL